MFCASEFWVIAALTSWAVFVGTWMLARYQTKRRPRLDTTIVSKRVVPVSSGDGGTTNSYTIYFNDSAGETQSVSLSRRLWKKADPGEVLVLYKKEGRREGYAHLSRPLRTANIPTLILLFVSFLGALFLPLLAGMTVTGTPFPGCV